MNTYFPGRWISGVTLVLGPVVLCIGYLLRYLSSANALTPQQQAWTEAWAEAQPFAAYGQLLAYTSEPGPAHPRLRGLRAGAQVLRARPPAPTGRSKVLSW